MNLEFRLLQYREDIDRQEGKNFALVAYDGPRLHLRALGLDRSGEFSIHAYKAFTEAQREAEWVFGEWIGWLKSFVDAGEKKDLEQALSRLEHQDTNIAATPLRRVQYLDGKPADKAVDDLEARLLKTRRAGRTFAARVEQFLERAAIKSRHGFQRDVEIEFAPRRSQPLVAFFPYAVIEEPRLAFKVIAHTGRKDHLSRQVNDAVLCFEKAADAGFLSRDQCIVLTEKIPRTSIRYTEPLRQVAILVDVDAENAAHFGNATFYGE